MIDPNIIEFIEITAFEIDPFSCVEKRQCNAFMESLICNHAIAPHDMRCSKCGKDWVDIMKSLEKGVNPKFQDTYIRGKFTSRIKMPL